MDAPPFLVRWRIFESMTTTTLGLALASYLIGSAFALAFLLGNRRGAARRVLVPTLVGFALHTLSLASVCIINGSWPVGSEAESFSFIAWGVVFFALILLYRNGAAAMASFALPLAALTTLLSLLQEEASSRALASFDAVSRDTWLFLHIALSLLAMAALLTAAAAGGLYLLQERQLKSRHPGRLFRRLPSLELSDRLCYRALSVGFVLLSAGLLAGLVGLWRSIELSWSWDLTRVLALAGWSLYLVVIYWRWSVGLRGRKAAVLAIAGSLSVTGILLGVLLLSGRFHPVG